MSRQFRLPLLLTLACFTFLAISASYSYAETDYKHEEMIPGQGGCDDCPPDGGGEGGDPEEILIRSRPAPPTSDVRFDVVEGLNAPAEWLIYLCDLIRVLR